MSAKVYPTIRLMFFCVGLERRKAPLWIWMLRFDGGNVGWFGGFGRVGGGDFRKLPKRQCMASLILVSCVPEFPNSKVYPRVFYDDFSLIWFLMGLWPDQDDAGAGSLCVLVSGGLRFLHQVAEMCGFSFIMVMVGYSNGVLSGRVLLQFWTRMPSRLNLNSYVKDLGLDLSQIRWPLDGAMILHAQLQGWGVGVSSQTVGANRVLNSIIYSDLTSLLYMQGVFVWRYFAIHEN